MNTDGNTSANAGQTASREAKAAGAASDEDMGLEDHGLDSTFDPNEELKDYNEDDPIPVLSKNK
jgi:hypothetical protein